MEKRELDALTIQTKESVQPLLINAVLMGSAASTSARVYSYQETGAPDTLVAICKQLAARVEELIRQGYTLAAALYIAQSEGWMDRVLPHLVAAMEVPQ